MRHLVMIATAALILAGALDVAARQLGAPGTSARAIPPRAMPRVLPGTRPAVFGTIQGNALNAANGSLANAVVRLRDARLGQVLDTQKTDKAGLFTFRTIDPGSYIVEVIGNDYSVLAASQILPVNAGEAVSAVVKLPFRISQLAGVLGSSTPSATAITAQAAASGVLATSVTQPISPNQ
jgi:hypothetical protein